MATNLQKFGGFKFQIQMDKIISNTAKEMRDDLRSTSPKGRRKNKYYRSTWQYKMNTTLHEATVYNKENYRLTHLLEHGHFIVNKKDGLLGWASPQPHISPSFNKIVPRFVKLMGEAPIDMVDI